ncbi:uncharacterized protein NP_7050A (plasmid) [Natronomonas pharaonis DSM 2160]|uniref:EF-hand domain-containing protein n=1 Tax=Natronomonas pharaonis (strain ATCC 35678 / DSM 2160 / CIP 103997 / JCM 8858 / NBRC 14720 / NCIMB 2260 / Gabara) TaxID=348780 RepID=Q3ILS9_NATPD|nr:hypothetical protein [Natronomonas pharaonis]CAI49754.1 uncharacterized protein NP_3326A [Natronomonas pharaonis DSM 2160]CAI50941.1 uncharacterized protein NP_7050A [Natronomonas pharaonis DSM 2160]
MKYEPEKKEIPGMPGTKLRKTKRSYSEQERQEILDRLTEDAAQDAEDDDKDDDGFVSQEELL